MSNDTLLRVVRRWTCPPTEPLIVAGIDDWAFRKNHRYGTVVCDLERRRIVALLPDRETATVRAWLSAHPEIRVSAGAGPTDADLAHAPTPFKWEPKLTPAQEPAIRGVVHGHPAIPDGEHIRAEILAVDPDLEWIRTWTGFFRLAAQSGQAA